MLTHFDFFNQVIRKFRDEELEHHDIGLEHDAELVRPTFTVCLWGSGHRFGKVEGRCSQKNRFPSDRPGKHTALTRGRQRRRSRLGL